MLKVTLLTVTLFVAALSDGFSQVFDTRGVTAPPSVSTDFLEAIHNSVNYQTGSVNLSLRLFSLKVDDKFEIPIDLTYTGNGIKFQQLSGEVGLGWTISSSYKITRTIYDRPDEHFAKPAVQDIYNNISADKYTRDKYLTSFTYGLPTSAGLTLGPSQPLLDGEYDLFDYNTPSASGTFAIQDVQNKVIASSKNLLAQFDYTKTSTEGIRTFTVKESNGNQVTCGYDPKRGGYFNNLVPTYGGYACIEWPVNKISTINNKTVEFAYIFRTVSEGQFSTERAITITEEVEGTTTPTETTTNDITDGTGASAPSYLTDSIISQFGYIKIFRNASISSAQIDSMALFDSYGQLIKKALFYRSVTLGSFFIDSVVIIGNSRKHPEVYKFDYYSRDNSLYLVPDIYDNLCYSTATRTAEKAYPQELASETYQRKDQTFPQPVSQIIGLGADRSPVGWPNYLSLKQVTYPTGGSVAYTYEPNYYVSNYTKRGPGIRVSSMAKFDPVSGITTIDSYEYGTGHIPVDVTADMYGLDQMILYPVSPAGPFPAFYAGRSRTFSNTVMSDNDPYFVRYNTVSYDWIKDNVSGNGYTIYYFNNSQQGNWGVARRFGNGFFYNLDLYANPNINKIEYYDNQNTLKKLENYDYGRYQGTTLTGIKAKPLASFSTGLFNPYAYNSYSYDGDLYEYTSYTVGFDKCWLSGKSVYNYENGTLQQINSYSYNQSGQLVTAIDTLSDLAIRTISYTYPNSYTGLNASGDPITNDILKMQQANLLDPWIEQITKIKRNGIETVATSQLQTYFPGSNKPRKRFDFVNSAQIGFQPASVSAGKVIVDANYLAAREELFEVDPYGNPLRFKNDKSENVRVIWGYKGLWPIATVMCGDMYDSTSFAYTSFEPDSKGNWIYTKVPAIDASAPTGRYSYNLNNDTIQRTGVTVGKIYVVSYWSKNGVYTIAGGSGSLTTGKTVAGWTYYQHKVTASGSTIRVIAGSGAHYIDELRLYPWTAQMTTYTYQPLVGKTSQSDPSGKINYYEYDDRQRLLRIRDMDGNIIKTVDYRFQGQ